MAEINHLNSRAKANRTGLNYEALLRDVKPHILEKILNIYYLDFSLFGYDINPFLEIVNKKYKDERAVTPRDNQNIREEIRLINKI